MAKRRFLGMAAASLAALTLAACGAVPRGEAGPKPRPQAGSPAKPSREAAVCLSELAAQKAQFAPLPDRYFEAGCSTLGAVRLEKLAGDRGALGVSNLNAVACPLATGFAAWARYGVDRAAREVFGTGIARIETMGSYSCRKVAGTARMSAHARAEAIDVGGFILADGRRVSVLSGWGATREEQRFLRLVHASACKRFGTVLGPDYNAAHKDHLHIELGDGSFCR